MKRLAICLILLALTGTALGVHYLPPVKYAQEFTLHFSIYDSNSPWQFYETAPAADDIKIRKNGGAWARATNAVTDLDHTMSLVLTATEMTAAIVTVDVNDESAPALFGSDTWVIPTYGHSSALNELDLDSATVALTNSSITTSTFASGAINAAAIAADAIGASELATGAIDEILDNTLTNNKDRQSLAWYVQRGGGGDPLQITGTAQGGGSTNTIKLQAGQILANNACTPCTITLLTGTGAPAIRTGLTFVAATDILTIAGTWPGSTPDGTTTYLIQASPTSYFASEGVAQSAATKTIVIASGGVRGDNLTGLLQILSGTGSGTTVYNIIDSYDANDTLVISGAWAGDTPNSTSYYVFTPSGGLVADASAPTPGPTVSEIVAGVIDATMDSNDVEVAVLNVVHDELGYTDTRAAYLDYLPYIGTPVAFDGGLATIAGMLTKMADDNGGADFDATHHSLYALVADVAAIAGGAIEGLVLQAGTVATAGTAKSFTLSTDFLAVEDAYRPGTLLLIKDADTGKYGMGIIRKYTVGRVATLEADLPFTPANADEAVIPAAMFRTPWRR